MVKHHLCGWEIDSALDWYEKGVEQRQPFAALWASSAQLEPLRSSPRWPKRLSLALAAWILEKFYTWGDCNGDIESAFCRETLITNLMYSPKPAARTARIYYESARMTPPLLRAGKGHRADRRRRLS